MALCRLLKSSAVSLVKLILNWFWFFFYDFEKGKSETKNSQIESELHEALDIVETSYYYLEDITKTIKTLRKLLK
jgi:hypothetical protein